jgi:hypothetical protein
VPRLRLPKKDRDPRDRHDPLFVKDPVAHGEGVNNPDPDLAWFLGQVGKRVAELRIQTQASVEFFQGRKKLLGVAALSG